MKIYISNLGMLHMWLPPKLLLIMKFIVIILFTCFMQVSASSVAQKLTYVKTNATVKEIFKEITNQTGYQVLYANKVVNDLRKINADFKNASLIEVMDRCLEKQELTYSIDESKGIVIKQKEPSLLDRTLLVHGSVAKDLTVKGKVTDQDGKPLPNASIRVKGKSAVTNTNAEGEFEIKGVDEVAVLLVSYVGFKTLEIELKDAVMPLEIKLNVATGELEEVKVVYSTGYQTIPKERATGSFVQLSNEDINRTVSSNILDRIYNITSSLRTQKVGTSNVSIRGLSTINANQFPLIVVDGFPYDENFGKGDVQLILNNLNPNDVESVTVLRDAAAASIWGARSANGVIVITTKKGKYNEKLTIQFNSSVNVLDKPDLFKANLMTSRDVMDYEKGLFASGFYNSYNGPFTSTYTYPIVSPAVEIMLAQRRGAITQTEADRQLEMLASHDVRSDINKYLLKTGVNTQNNLNVSGGNDKMHSYTSFGYDKNITPVIGNKSDRITFRTDNTFRPIKQLEINSYFSYVQSQSINNGINYSEFIADGSRAMAPYTMLADINGNPLHVPSRNPSTLRTAYVDTLSLKGLLDWHYRPLDEINVNDKSNKNFTARLGGNIRYKIFQGISVTVGGQFQRALTSVNSHYSTETFTTRNLINTYMYLNSVGQPQYPIPNAGILDYSTENNRNWNFRSTININQSWNEHNLDGFLSYEVGETSLETNTSRKYGYNPLTMTYATNMDYNTLFARRPVGQIRTTNVGSLNGRLNRFQSYIGNMAYSFKGKYILSGSFRVDASNFFGVKTNLKYVPLWSVGVSWDLMKEDFAKPNWLDVFKLRSTYGFNGNLNNTATSLPTIRYSNGNSVYNGSQQYATVSSPPNPGLTWEKLRVINLGADFGLFKNKIVGSFDFYTKKGVNLIGSLNIDPTSGFTTYVGNYASIKGKGIDLNLTSRVIDREFKIISNILLSYNVDRVTDYYLDKSILDNGNSYVTGNAIPLVGKPRYKLYSYRWGGLSNDNGTPLGIVNGNTVPFTVALGNSGSIPNTKPDDLNYNGYAMAPYFGSLINTLSYRELSFSFNLTYKLGYSFRRQSINYSSLQGNWGGHGDFALRWKAPGDELHTTVPALPITTDSRYSFYQYSEVLVERGDFIRLQDIRLTYSMNKLKYKFMPFKSTSLFLNANNLGLLWSANKENIDPESDNNGIPLNRTFAFGLNINF